MNQQQKRTSTIWQQYRIVNKVCIGGIFSLLLLPMCIRPGFESQPAGATTRASNPIKHIVIMVKENRTFDTMFGTFPGADGATTFRLQGTMTVPRISP